MKKFKNILSIIIIGMLSFSISNAELEITDISITDNTSSGIIVDSEIITTTTTNIEGTSYIYYYGQGCSYCAQLDRYLNKIDGYSKLDIIKKEVYYNDDNRTEMLNVGERLGLNASDIGVPFVVKIVSGEETPMIGIDTIMNEFEPILGDIPESNKKPIVFTILVILAIIIPVFLIKLSNKS